MKIYNVNPLHLIFRNVNGYFEEINKTQYLTPDPTNETKEKNMNTCGVKLWVKL